MAERVDAAPAVRQRTHGPQRHGEQRHSADLGRLLAERRKFLYQHPQRQSHDDHQVHDAAREEQQHQRPAAAQAIDAVVSTQPECGERA